MAIKEGSSSQVHIDGNDHGVTWILPLGDWEGAYMVTPEVDSKLSIRSGELFAFSANKLAHFSTPVIAGTRVAITLFTCHNVFNDAQTRKY